MCFPNADTALRRGIRQVPRRGSGFAGIPVRAMPVAGGFVNRMAVLAVLRMLCDPMRTRVMAVLVPRIVRS